MLPQTHISIDVLDFLDRRLVVVGRVASGSLLVWLRHGLAQHGNVASVHLLALVLPLLKLKGRVLVADVTEGKRTLAFFEVRQVVDFWYGRKVLDHAVVDRDRSSAGRTRERQDGTRDVALTLAVALTMELVLPPPCLLAKLPAAVLAEGVAARQDQRHLSACLLEFLRAYGALLCLSPHLVLRSLHFFCSRNLIVVEVFLNNF